MLIRQNNTTSQHVVIIVIVVIIVVVIMSSDLLFLRLWLFVIMSSDLLFLRLWLSVKQRRQFRKHGGKINRGEKGKTPFLVQKVLWPVQNIVTLHEHGQKLHCFTTRYKDK